MQVNTPNTSLIEMRIFSRDLQRIKMTPQKKLRCNCASLSESHHKLSGSRSRMQLKKNWLRIGEQVVRFGPFMDPQKCLLEFHEMGNLFRGKLI